MKETNLHKFRNKFPVQKGPHDDDDDVTTHQTMTSPPDDDVAERVHGPHMSAIHWTSRIQRADAMSPVALRAPMATTRLPSTAIAAAADVLAALQTPTTVVLPPPPGLVAPSSGRTANCSP